jgi:uncharacterized membrane protein
MTRIFRIGAPLWLVMVAAGPLLVSRPAGSPWQPVGFAVYGVAQVVCHQRVERTYHFGGVPLPVCARCTGIYAGAALAALAVGVSRWRRRMAGFSRFGRERWLLFAAALPTVVTVILEAGAGLPVSNDVRAAAGSLLGLGVGWPLMEPGPSAEAAPGAQAV